MPRPLGPQRPSQPGGSTRTDDIRDTAARLFERSGYSATTMSDIAEAVGVLPGSLYHHFPSKEDIAVDLLTRYRNALTALGTATLRRAGEAPGDPERFLCGLLAGMVGLSFEHGAAVWLGANEAPSVSTERLAAACRLKSPSLDRAWRTAAGALFTGRPAAADPALLRVFLQRLGMSAPFYLSPATGAEAIAAQYCDVLLHGLVIEPIPVAELEASAAHRAALDALAGWDSRARAAADGVTADILAAARTEFARRGYEATTIRDIATTAGVKMGTLYRRVDSKETLLQTIIKVYAESLGEAFDAVVSSGSGEIESLYAVIRILGHASRRFGDETHIVSFGWSERHLESSPFHAYSLTAQGRLDLLRDLFRRSVKNGLVRPIADPDDMAVVFRSVLWLSIHRHTRASEERVFDFLRQSLMYGAAARA